MRWWWCLAWMAAAVASAQPAPRPAAPSSRQPSAPAGSATAGTGEANALDVADSDDAAAIRESMNASQQELEELRERRLMAMKQKQVQRVLGFDECCPDG